MYPVCTPSRKAFKRAPNNKKRAQARANKKNRAQARPTRTEP
jgi:hypothetical protein